jgi:hypothetical protein
VVSHWGKNFFSYFYQQVKNSCSDWDFLSFYDIFKKRKKFQCDTTFFQTIPLRSNAIPLFSNDTAFFDTADTTLHFPSKNSKFKQTVFGDANFQNSKKVVLFEFFGLPLKKSSLFEFRNF